MSAFSKFPREYKLRIKRQLYSQQCGLCAYCESPVSFEEATIDHLIPVSRGGTNYFHNLRIACEPCNLMKANWLPDDSEATA